MLDGVSLPKDKLSLARVMRTHAAREEMRMMYRRTMWMLAWYYFNGVRNFQTFDVRTGKVAGEYVNANGDLEFQSQELLNRANQVIARLMSMDIRPLVLRNGLSLGAIRSRATAQVILDSLTDAALLQRVGRDLATTFTFMGSAGISTSLGDDPTIGLTADFEVVHPREILPWPSLGMDLSKQRGIMRQRTVPLEFLENVYGNKVRRHLEDMEYYETELGATSTNWGVYGDSMYPLGGSPMVVGGGGATGWGSGGGAGGTGDTAKDTTYKVVVIRELWMYGTRGTVCHYACTSGDHVFSSEDLDGMGVYCPLSFHRFMETGAFHGAGIFDMLYPIAREHERLVSALFNNIRDSDRYGVIVMPTGQWNLKNVLQDVGRGLRVLPWEPDPIAEGFKPFPIQPWNTGDAPGRVSAMAKDLMDSIDPIKDLIENKGRVDSAEGLAFLDEQSRQTLTQPSDGFVGIWAGAYRSAAQQASKALLLSQRSLPVTNMTTDLVGAVIDPETGDVSFKKNPVPDVARLIFTVKNINPRSELARKQEGLLMAKTKAELGLPDWNGFILFALKEGLDYALWMDDARAAYEAVTRNIILLFNDGVQPGEIMVAPQWSRPELQLMVLTAFMGDVPLTMASPEVQDAFLAYRDDLMSFMGMVLPSAIPNPEDAALLNATAPMPGLPQGDGAMMNQQQGQAPA